MEKILENLKEAEKTIRNTDHLIYLTFPLIKEKRILIKAITEIKIATKKCIGSILQYEYLNKNIKLYKDSKINFQTFKKKCSKKYQITQKEIEILTELFNLAKFQKKSSMEFMKDNKIIIMGENYPPQQITLEKIKEFLITSKNLLEKTKKVINSG